MRLTTVILLFVAIGASFASGLTNDSTLAWTARLLLALAFAGAVVTFALTLPRRPAEKAPDEPHAGTGAGRGEHHTAGLRRAVSS